MCLADSYRKAPEFCPRKACVSIISPSALSPAYHSACIQKSLKGSSIKISPFFDKHPPVSARVAPSWFCLVLPRSYTSLGFSNGPAGAWDTERDVMARWSPQHVTINAKGSPHPNWREDGGDGSHWDTIEAFFDHIYSEFS